MYSARSTARHSQILQDVDVAYKHLFGRGFSFSVSSIGADALEDERREQTSIASF